MIVVADASPLNYLIQIGCAWVLPLVYDRIVVPNGVVEELERDHTPQKVRDWIANCPDWIERIGVMSIDDSLSRLDLGEREAIQLFRELRADLLLIDERKGRLEAARRGIPTTGNLGVLAVAEKRGLVDAKRLYYLLISETTFRSSKGLEEQFLKLIRQ